MPLLYLHDRVVYNGKEWGIFDIRPHDGEVDLIDDYGHIEPDVRICDAKKIRMKRRVRK